METQGKRLLLAVALAFAVILGWNLLFPAAKKEPPAKPPVAGETAGSATAPPAAPPMGMPTAAAPSAAAAQQPAQKIVLSFPGKFDATFSSRGGTLVSWKLADKRFERDATKGELLEPGNGAFHVWFRKSKYDLPQNAEWTGTKVSDTEVRYTLSTPQFDVTKTYTVHPDAYLVKLDVKVVAKVPQGDLAPQNLAITSFAYQDPKADTEGSQQVAARVWNSATLRDGGHYQTTIKELFEAPRHESNITWTGFEHPYLLAAYAPHHQGNESVEKYTYAGPWLGLTKDDGMMRTDIVFPTANVKAGDTMSRELVAYLGPKNYRELDRANAAAGFSTGITSTIDFGWFGVIGKPMLWLLQQFYAFVGNWGIAIIMLTFVVKMLTLYWTTKSMRSMKAMAALAPQMKALQEKYKDDRQRLQVETMALYKQNSVNPIAGCLPILLQMPVWIALYRMLSNAGELYQAPFIPGWINDLTATDPYHILPVILVVTMFLQARMTPATGDSRQQKFLQYGMPLMFGVMSFFFPSGLTLYIFTNTVLSALHSIYMNKYDKQSLALAAKMKAVQAEAEAKAAAGAKSAGKGAAKPTKPSAAKPIIDVESSEAEGDDEGSTSGSPTSTPRPQGNRAKRKKRRR